jgi:hypothetical protein
MSITLRADFAHTFLNILTAPLEKIKQNIFYFGRVQINKWIGILVIDIISIERTYYMEYLYMEQKYEYKFVLLGRGWLGVKRSAIDQYKQVVT